MFPLFGAFYYWFPKWTGRMLGERTGLVELLAPVRRVQPDLLPDAPARAEGDAAAGLHVPAGAGVGRPEPAGHGRGLPPRAGRAGLRRRTSSGAGGAGGSPGADPWGAGTLEWATGSPPPRYNFRHPPTVRSRDPVWEDTARHAGGDGPERPTPARCWSPPLHDATPDLRYHIAGDSIWPLAPAIAVGGTLIGLIFHPVAVPDRGGRHLRHPPRLVLADQRAEADPPPAHPASGRQAEPPEEGA